MAYYIYILYSSSADSYYRGQTEDLTDRLHRYNQGMEKATRYGVPWQLIWYTEKPDRKSALLLEKKLKNLSRKRLLEFILKYQNGVAGPDDTDSRVSMSGC